MPDVSPGFLERLEGRLRMTDFLAMFCWSHTRLQQSKPEVSEATPSGVVTAQQLMGIVKLRGSSANILGFLRFNSGVIEDVVKYENTFVPTGVRTRGWGERRRLFLASD